MLGIRTFTSAGPDWRAISFTIGLIWLGSLMARICQHGIKQFMVLARIGAFVWNVAHEFIAGRIVSPAVFGVTARGLVFGTGVSLVIFRAVPIDTVQPNDSLNPEVREQVMCNDYWNLN